MHKIFFCVVRNNDILISVGQLPHENKILKKKNCHFEGGVVDFIQIFFSFHGALVIFASCCDSHPTNTSAEL